MPPGPSRAAPTHGKEKNKVSIPSNLPIGEDPIEILSPAPVARHDDMQRVAKALPELVRAARLAAAIRAPIDIVQLCAVTTSARVALKRAGLS